MIALLERRERAGRAAAAAVERAADRLRALPGWGQALAVYAATRILTALLTLAVARWQHASLWTPESPGYRTFTGDLWDSTWYRAIAQHGYPLPLPRGPDGAVQQSEWAFYPAYPVLVRVVTALTRGPWDVVAPSTSLVLGAVAVVVLRRLFARVAGPGPALAAVLLVCVFPTSPVLQYAYSESTALLALALALTALVERRYAWCALAVLLFGASRAVELPFAGVVVAHGVARWRAEGRAFGARSRLAVLALAALSVAAGLAWPLAVGLATGVPSAYTQVQGAWRSGTVTWLEPWLVTSQRLGGQVGGPLLLLTLLAALVWWCTGPRARALGVELPAWVLAYTAYLLLVVDPWTSVFRFWLLQVPLALLVATGLRSRAHLLTWAGALFALQIVWVAWIWRFSPPSDFPP